MEDEIKSADPSYKLYATKTDDNGLDTVNTINVVSKIILVLGVFGSIALLATENYIYAVGAFFSSLIISCFLMVLCIIAKNVIKIKTNK